MLFFFISFSIVSQQLLSVAGSFAAKHLLVTHVGPCEGAPPTIVNIRELSISTKTFDTLLSGEFNITEDVAVGWSAKASMQKCQDIRNTDTCDHLASARAVTDGCGEDDAEEIYTLMFQYTVPQEIMDNQLAELLAEPSGEFYNFVRMSNSDFEILIQKISPIVAKQDTKLRESIPVKIRLAITLRYLATGDSYRSLHYLFKVSSPLISRIVPQVCLALNETLKEFVKIPTTTEEWLSKAGRFKFPHCLGAIDGKHVTILQPPHSGTEYYNYKNSFSIVLLALVDHDYCFMFAEIGAQGRISDGGIFNQSSLSKKISENSINLPPPSLVPGCEFYLPYVFLGDGAFALSKNLMKPFPGHHALNSAERVFNQKLSQSRVVVENTFGILANKFRVFKTAMPFHPVKCSIITMTCVLLHNFLRKSRTSRNLYTPPGIFDTFNDNGDLVNAGTWRNDNITGFLPLQNQPRRTTNDAIQIRQNFKNYLYTNRE